VLAPEAGVTLIVGADVFVVTVGGHPTEASGVLALVIQGARATVVAGKRVGDEVATVIRVAHVVRAGVIVETGSCCARAPAIAAKVICGTGVGIIARVGVGSERTARLATTAIVGARIVIIARQRPSTNARPEVAVVAGGTDIAVVARRVAKQV